MTFLAAPAAPIHTPRPRDAPGLRPRRILSAATERAKAAIAAMIGMPRILPDKNGWYV